MPPAIQITNLVKRFGTLTALNGISLEVSQGSFFGFLGPNGAGKTTTINILTGLTNRTSGEVQVFGKDVTRNYMECRRRIGLAPQEFNFDRFFSIKKLLEFQAGYFGIAPREASRRADQLLERFGLTDKRDERTTKLSGGFRRRVQLAKAMVHDPDILILDEPTAGVDVELRYELWDYLREMNKAGKTILLTTHYLEEAEKLCEEIAIIFEGAIVERGNTKDLLSQSGTNLERLFLNHVGADRNNAHA